MDELGNEVVEVCGLDEVCDEVEGLSSLSEVGTICVPS